MGTIQIDGSTPKLTIGNATAEDALILFDGNAQDYHVGLDDSSDSLVIGLGSALGTTPAMTVNSSQVVTFAQNPVFPDGGVAVADLDIDGATDIGAAIVDADLFIVDDGAGGTNRKTVASRFKTYIGDSTPAFSAEINAADNFSDASWVKAEFDSEFFDSDSAYDHSTNFRFTPAVAGKYMLIVSVMLTSNADTEWDEGGIRIYKNGSAFHEFVHDAAGSRPHSQSFTCHMVDTADSDDYYEVYIYTNDTSGDPTISGLSSSVTRGVFTGIRIMGA